MNALGDRRWREKPCGGLGQGQLGVGSAQQSLSREIHFRLDQQAKRPRGSSAAQVSPGINVNQVFLAGSLGARNARDRRCRIAFEFDTYVLCDLPGGVDHKCPLSNNLTREFYKGLARTTYRASTGSSPRGRV